MLRFCSFLAALLREFTHKISPIERVQFGGIQHTELCSHRQCSNMLVALKRKPIPTGSHCLCPIVQHLTATTYFLIGICLHWTFHISEITVWPFVTGFLNSACHQDSSM